MCKESAGENLPWTAHQRQALIILLSVLFVCLAGRYACDRAFINDPPGDAPMRSGELADRFDPNSARWEELAAIPTFGEKKAKALVAYRENWSKKHPNDPAFRGPQDLRNVKGIGPATVSNMMPYLMFPKLAVRATTRP